MEREMKKKIKNVMKTVETKASPSPSSPAPAPARRSREMARRVFEDNEKKLLGKGLSSPPLPACFMSCFPPRPNETPSSCPSSPPPLCPLYPTLCLTFFPGPLPSPPHLWAVSHLASCPSSYQDDGYPGLMETNLDPNFQIF